MKIELELRTVAIVLGAVVIGLTMICIALLVIGSVTGHSRLLGLIPLFDVGLDANIPTWFSSILLLFCSALLALIAAEHTRRADRSPLAWWVLSAMFLIFSIDEVGKIHERVGNIFGTMILRQVEMNREFPTAVWIVAFIPLVILVVVGFLPFFLRLPRRTQIGIAIAAIMFVGGGMGFEALSHYWHRDSELIFYVFTVIEEFLEMAGALVFACVLIDYMATALGGVVIRIQVGQPEPDRR